MEAYVRFRSTCAWISSWSYVYLDLRFFMCLFSLDVALFCFITAGLHVVTEQGVTEFDNV